MYAEVPDAREIIFMVTHPCLDCRDENCAGCLYSKSSRVRKSAATYP